MGRFLKTWCDVHQRNREVSVNAVTGNKSWCKECYTDKRTAETTKDRQLKCVYGISLEDYRLMLSEQGGRCAICRTDDPRQGRKTNFVVDHDHTTGKIRGLLCVRCNSGLGMFKDSPDALSNAIVYLTKNV